MNRQASILVRVDNMDALKTEATYSTVVELPDVGDVSTIEAAQAALDSAPELSRWLRT